MKKLKTWGADSTGQECCGVPEGKCSIERRALERSALDSDSDSPLTCSVDLGEVQTTLRHID